MREEYRKWRDSLPSAEGDLETLLAQEDRRDDALDAYWDAGYYGQNSTKLEDIFC